MRGRWWRRKSRGLARSVRAGIGWLRQTLQVDPWPLRHQLRGYGWANLGQDLRAGCTVALLALPQGMAYAMLAKLPIQFGVYCSAVAAIIAPFFGGSRFLMVGPTNATAVLLLSVFLSLPPEIDRFQATTFLVFLTGLLMLAAAFLQLASLLKFISRSVIIGYITGAALLIMANQLHHALGTEIGVAPTLLELLQQTFESLGETNWAALGLAAFTMTTIFALRQINNKLPSAALALFLAGLLAVGLGAMGWSVPMVDPLPREGLHLTPPPLGGQWFFLLTGPAVAVAFIAAMEATLMAKTLAAKHGETSNPNQVLFGLGWANLGSGFLGGMPASGSLTNSALNERSGASTAVASIVSGGICLGAAYLLGPITAYLPKAALAALVITVAISLLDFRRIRVALRATRSDAAVLLATLTAAIFTPLDFAIFVGVAVSIALFLHQVSTPKLVEYSFNEEGNLAEAEQKRAHPHLAIIHVEGELFFGAADLFREELRRVGNDPSLRVLILRMRHAHHLDATSLLALEELILALRQSGRHLLLSGASKELYRLLRNTGVFTVLGRENFFLAVPSNPNLATRRALLRAQELLGKEKVEVRIYTQRQE
jgi:SulP family sulfate permease